MSRLNFDQTLVSTQKLWLVGKKNFRKTYIIVDIAQKIIRKSANDQIAFNNIYFKDFKQMWDKLKNICIKVS